MNFSALQTTTMSDRKVVLSVHQPSFNKRESCFIQRDFLIIADFGTRANQEFVPRKLIKKAARDFFDSLVRNSEVFKMAVLLISDCHLDIFVTRIESLTFNNHA